MKSLLTIFLSLVVLTSGMAQTVRRVNNIAGVSGTNVYTTAQAAHDAAVANDIIIIDPSVISYGDLTLTKPLKIYGNGYFLTTNTELKADQRNSTLGTVYFNTGSGGSEIYGISGSNLYIHGVSNITVSRNNFSGIILYNTNKVSTINTSVSNIVISRNYITYVQEAGTAGFTISNVLINNNILTYITALNDPRDQSWVIRHNTITSQPSTGTVLLANCVFENNLLTGSGAFNYTGVTFSYNVSTGATFSIGTGNVNSYDLITNSDLVGAGTGISADEAYQIKAGSSLKTLGSSSSEVGAYGGSTPYVVSGIPSIPSITSMVNTGTGDASTPIKVTISVKSNN